MTYAADTSVSPEKSRAEIERLVTKYGATKFVSGWEEVGAAVLFEMRGRRVRFTIPMPNPKDRKFTHDRYHLRTPADQKRRVDQATRTAWRALLLVIKAKLEAVEAGIAVFESEFLAHIVLPGTGQTFGEWAIPQIARAYEEAGAMPPMLPMGPPSLSGDSKVTP